MTDVGFVVHVEWSGRGREASGVLHTGGQAVAYSAPESMGGKGEGTSPEDLLVSAVAGCYTATLGGLLARGGLPTVRLQVTADGTVTDFPGKEARVSKITVGPDFVGADDLRREEYKAAAQHARDRCFVGHQLAAHVAYEVGEITFSTEADVDGLLDVRSLPPARRHQLIFESIDRLLAGQAITLVNDHDPLPLRYQLEATRAASFSWDYLEEGPETWRVRIGRRR